MVAAGCTNVQVARALFLSQATVGKHLENIYARLDVTNRTAAAATITALERPA
jgi:DNA-binding NarL/FixJ family response regulator